MRHIALCLCLSLLPALPAGAGRIEDARASIAAGELGVALELLEPAARSGNADAEAMMGAIHGMGFTGRADAFRAFDWYQRAALKGHAGAQMSLGWCYEKGMGLPAADPVRAFLWFSLAAIGGAEGADAAAEALRGRLSEDEVEKAHAMIADYKDWLYPLR